MLATGCAATETKGVRETRWSACAFIRRCLAKTPDKFELWHLAARMGRQAVDTDSPPGRIRLPIYEYRALVDRILASQTSSV